MSDRASIFLLREDGAALMQKRDNIPNLLYAGMWGLPGGTANPGELLEDCIRRELKEETDYQSQGPRFLAEIDDHPAGFSRYQVRIFWESYDGLQVLECHEGEMLKFVRRSEIDHYPIPGFLVPLWDQALDAEKKGPPCRMK